MDKETPLVFALGCEGVCVRKAGKEDERTGVYAVCGIEPVRPVYVGKADNFLFRWKGHLSELRRRKHHCRRLQEWFDALGGKSPVFVVLETIDHGERRRISLAEAKWFKRFTSQGVELLNTRALRPEMVGSSYTRTIQRWRERRALHRSQLNPLHHLTK